MSYTVFANVILERISETQSRSLVPLPMIDVKKNREKGD